MAKPGYGLGSISCCKRDMCWGLHQDLVGPHWLRDNGEALHLTGLCLMWFRVTIFSFNLILPCSITSGSSMSQQLQLIIPSFRRRWMGCFLREQLNHLLVVLLSFLVCLWFLSILVASGPYLTLSGLIIICMYLPLRC